MRYLLAILSLLVVACGQDPFIGVYQGTGNQSIVCDNGDAFTIGPDAARITIREARDIGTYIDGADCDGPIITDGERFTILPHRCPNFVSMSGLDVQEHITGGTGVLSGDELGITIESELRYSDGVDCEATSNLDLVRIGEPPR